MRYTADLTCGTISEEKGESHSNEKIPVLFFQVDGGTSRMIDLKKDDDVSIISELEQSRQFKNIVLYIASTNDHRSMKLALDLADLYQNSRSFWFTLWISKFAGKKEIESLNIGSNKVMLKSQPRNGLKNTMLAELDFLDDVDISRMSLRGRDKWRNEYI